MQVRRRNAVTTKLQACLAKSLYQAMTPTGDVDLRSDSGCRRLNGDADDEVKGYAEAWTHACWQSRRPSR
eukprot:9481219-Pyramimonas_sp.AAC.1